MSIHAQGQRRGEGLGTSLPRDVSHNNTIHTNKAITSSSCFFKLPPEIRSQVYNLYHATFDPPRHKVLRVTQENGSLAKQTSMHQKSQMATTPPLALVDHALAIDYGQIINGRNAPICVIELSDGPVSLGDFRFPQRIKRLEIQCKPVECSLHSMLLSESEMMEQKNLRMDKYERFIMESLELLKQADQVEELRLSFQCDQHSLRTGIYREAQMIWPALYGLKLGLSDNRIENMGMRRIDVFYYDRVYRFQYTGEGSAARTPMDFIRNFDENENWRETFRQLVLNMSRSTDLTSNADCEADQFFKGIKIDRIQREKILEIKECMYWARIKRRTKETKETRTTGD